MGFSPNEVLSDFLIRIKTQSAPLLTRCLRGCEGEEKFIFSSFSYKLNSRARVEWMKNWKAEGKRYKEINKKFAMKSSGNESIFRYKQPSRTIFLLQSTPSGVAKREPNRKRWKLQVASGLSAIKFTYPSSQNSSLGSNRNGDGNLKQ